jgi:hypothetical protein
MYLGLAFFFVRQAFWMAFRSGVRDCGEVHG